MIISDKMKLSEEFDEIERLENEANLLREERSHLLYKEASAKYDKTINTDGIPERLEEIRIELNRLLGAIEVAKLEMGDEYDRYKANKRK